MQVFDPRRGSWIQTFTGRRFWPLSARVEDVCLEDIAHHEAMICRFTGAIKRFYAVGEHSVRVSWLVEQLAIARGLDPLTVALLALWGLLHDGTEAYLADIASPVKRSPEFEPYRVAENNLEEIILSAFNLHGLAEFRSLIKTADLVMLVTEARELLRNGPRADWFQPNVTPLRRSWWARVVWDRFGWSPRKAEKKFLARFRELQKKISRARHTSKLSGEFVCPHGSGTYYCGHCSGELP